MKGIIKIFCDGGSRGNPGKSASAFVVEENGKVIHSGAKYLGTATNNFAEYSAVFLALNWVRENKNISEKEIVFVLDSELVARQINGVYRVKDKKLREIFSEIKSVLERIPQEILFKNVAREKNKLADALVNETLDKVL